VSGAATEPAPGACRLCGRAVDGQDVAAGRAERSARGGGICPRCLPHLQKQRAAKAGQPPIAKNESFIALVEAAREDPDIRRQIEAILRLDPFNRESMVNTCADQMALAGAPRKLVQAFRCLADDEIAMRTRDLLQAQ
jgi:hypothetical protein